MQDLIFIKNAPFSCHIGCTKEERIQPQNIIINITITTDTQRAAKSCDLKDSICYHTVYKKIADSIKNHQFTLQEELANIIADTVLEFKLAQKVTVNIQKPEALKQYGVESAGVEITRKT